MSDNKRVLILGATSAIAEHWARGLAEAGDHLLLVGSSKDARVRQPAYCGQR